MNKISLTQFIGLAIRLLARDWRSGELNILILALIIAAASTATTGLFSDRLNRTMVMQAAAFLAADLVVTSHAALPEQWLEKATASRLKMARSTEFSSVLVHDESILLCGIKAVTNTYPLRGHLKTTTGSMTDEKDTVEIPVPGTAWVETRVLSALDLAIGDSIEVGEKPLKITRILTYEPDRRDNLLGLTPRVIMHHEDLPASGMIRPGSHVHYYFLFAGPEIAVREFKTWLQSRLVPGQRIMDIYEDRPELATAFKRAEEYLGLASVVVVMIAGVAIAMAARRYSRRHFDMTAILRCLGVRQNQVLWLFYWQLLLLGLAASAVGCVIGWLSQEILVWYLRDLLPENLAAPGIFAYVMAILAGLVILAGFTLAPLLQQRRVSPLRVLRRDLVPAPLNQGVVYGAGFLTLSALVWWNTGDWRLVLYFLAAAAGAILCSGGLVYLLLRTTRVFLPHLGMNTRFGIQQLSRNATSNLSQILAFGVTFTAMIVIFLVRTDLIKTWQGQLPQNTPNYFAFNIFPAEWETLKDWLGSEKIEVPAFYPVIRGRLIQINGQDAGKIVSANSQAENALNRDLNLTYTDVLPADNRMKGGNWWNNDDTHLVSVEQSLAESLKTKVGDTMTFTIGSREIVVTVSSIRSVQWDTMNPNFYFIFSPGTLEGFPSTYLTSFYLPADKQTILNRLVNQFPSISVLEVGLIIRQIQTILGQVTVAIEFVLFFSLLAGIVVLFAAVYSDIDERIFNACILRTLGAGRRVIRQNQCVEFVSLGLIAGILGAASSELLLWFLYERIFDLPVKLYWKVGLATPIAGAALIGSFGLWVTRRTVRQSPLILIREN
ncbi:MAG: ABC transporter permease [Methylococcales bacterium]